MTPRGSSSSGHGGELRDGVVDHGEAVAQVEDATEDVALHVLVATQCASSVRSAETRGLVYVQSAPASARKRRSSPLPP